jgi:hypothetical protein
MGNKCNLADARAGLLSQLQQIGTWQPQPGPPPNNAVRWKTGKSITASAYPGSLGSLLGRAGKGRDCGQVTCYSLVPVNKNLRQMRVDQGQMEEGDGKTSNT